MVTQQEISKLLDQKRRIEEIPDMAQPVFGDGNELVAYTVRFPTETRYALFSYYIFDNDEMEEFFEVRLPSCAKIKGVRGNYFFSMEGRLLGKIYDETSPVPDLSDIALPKGQIFYKTIIDDGEDMVLLPFVYREGLVHLIDEFDIPEMEPIKTDSIYSFLLDYYADEALKRTFQKRLDEIK